MFSRFQAGFHKGWSCEDQITRIVQSIEDRFQQRPMKHSVLSLLEFSKAYYTVWREKLLLHKLNTGIPPTFIRWIRSFLSDRRGVFNSSTSVVTVDLLLKAYLKVLSLLLYSCCSTLIIWPLHSTTMQLLLSFPMTSLSSCRS